MDTVKELIEALQKMPKDKTVFAYDEHFAYSITNVFIDEDGDVGIRFDRGIDE